MFLIREIVHCRPGKVREMVGKFKTLASVMKRKGYKPFRIMTDLSGERFWTVIAETEIEGLDKFLEMEAKVMADDEASQTMGGYHVLVEQGRREIYKIEA